MGSIGVIRASFGFEGMIAKLGVERRVQTSGQSKSQLDPFLPEAEADLARSSSLMHAIHGSFIDAVKEGRGDRLKPAVAAAKFNAVVHGGASAASATDSADAAGGAGDAGGAVEAATEGDGEGGDGVTGLFDGAYYAGADALEIGLIDSLGDMHSVLQERFGEDVVMKEHKPKGGFALPFALPFGGEMMMGSDGGDGGNGGGVSSGIEGVVDAVAARCEETALWRSIGR